MSYLFYVAGPSGSGKDSLINGLRDRLGGGSSVLFAHRYITRCWQAGGENHVELSEEEFRQRSQAGLFSMQWQANNCRYAIGVEISHWLNSGYSVVVNGSRAHLEEATSCFGDRLIPILVTVDPAVLRQRLQARGREEGGEIDARIARNQIFEQRLHGRAIEIANDTDLCSAVDQFHRIVMNHTEISADVEN
ncbi:ribose 1,5-bisphosphokinase [Amphritea atlantica]|uniref:Ribose 1,5-bisphosphate phosphokinase PhnN n=1 Tax=Amphritea atlantica TaxID=355243 RepID=A0A1H9DCF7_9GAMM|nr:ribose 1,5-bisphosphokinase [Amphritea atlantica]SEQ11154.1 ribose 1,5-bisphosphokinase [Amphritea atlantica]